MKDMTPKNIEKYRKHYSESRLLAKIGRTFKKAGLKVIYPVLLLYYVLADESTPLRHKVTIAGTLGYFILPFDLMPDLLPLLGYADDAAALAACLKTIYSSVTPQIKSKARGKLQEWYDRTDYESIEEYDRTCSK